MIFAYLTTALTTTNGLLYIAHAELMILLDVRGGVDAMKSHAFSIPT